MPLARQAQRPFLKDCALLKLFKTLVIRLRAGAPLVEG
jgi:hypothetical protein